MSAAAKYAWVLSILLITQGCEFTPAQWDVITAFCRAAQAHGITTQQPRESP